jgi:methylthioribose-1-phosphate isomerase
MKIDGRAYRSVWRAVDGKRGAPLIGATAAYGICLALAGRLRRGAGGGMRAAARTRPTAINLLWALDEMVAAVRNRPRGERLRRPMRGPPRSA